jgi:MFS family permease
MKIYLSLLRKRRQFRYLWLAQVVSLMGDWFNTIASVILVNRYTESGMAVGLFFLARSLPPFLLGPVAGVIADRFNRKAVLIVSDLLRAGIVLGFLLVNSAERIWLLYVLSIAQFAVSAFFEPARAAILPSLIDADEILTANTLSSATWSAMLAIGAAVGGFTANALGVPVALLIDASTFLISALLVTRIVAPPLAEEESVQVSGWQDFVDGLAYVRQQPRIGLIALVKGMGHIGSVDVMIAVFAERVFPVGEDGALTLGLMFAFHGVGAVAGPLITNLLTDQQARSLQRAITWGYAIIAISWLGWGLAPSLGLVLIAAMLRGMGGSINWTYSSVLLQIEVPDRFLGRVFALDFAFFTLMMSFAVLASGFILDGPVADPRRFAILLAVGALPPLLIWALSIRRGRFATPSSSMSPGD